MKKFLSIIMSVSIVVTSLCFSMTAFAKTKDDVQTKITAAAQNTFTAYGSKYIVELAKSGIDLSSVKDTYLDSIKSKIDAAKTGDGKIYDETGKYESVATYAETIETLKLLGEDPTNFDDFNLVKAYQNMTFDKDNESPYSVRYGLEVSKYVTIDSTFLKSVADFFVTNYYTKGEGYNYWGYSSNNDAQLITGLSYMGSDYQAVIDDELNLLAKYNTDDGYLYATNSESADADSTALALMAYSATSKTELAKDAYNKLLKFESSTTGIFTGYDSNYATHEALYSLEYYLDFLNDNHSLTYSVKAPSSLKLTKKSKSFKAKWKKVASVSGYQIQYSTSKKFTNKKTKTKSVKKATTVTATVSSLKSKKTYYVRVRAYKNVNGTKKYSKWSNIKKVKTK